jgi:hypothetical protein
LFRFNFNPNQIEMNKTKMNVIITMCYLQNIRPSPSSWIVTTNYHYWCAPKLLDRFKCEFEMKTMEEQGVTSWLVHSLSTFGARTNHGHTRTNKIHHNPDLGEATTFPLIVYIMVGHGTNIQMTFCPRTPKWEFWNSHNWGYFNFGGP